MLQVWSASANGKRGLVLITGTRRSNHHASCDRVQKQGRAKRVPAKESPQKERQIQNHFGWPDCPWGLIYWCVCRHGAMCLVSTQHEVICVSRHRRLSP